MLRGGRDDAGERKVAGAPRRSRCDACLRAAEGEVRPVKRVTRSAVRCRRRWSAESQTAHRPTLLLLLRLHTVQEMMCWDQ